MKMKNILGAAILVFILAGSVFAAIPQKMGYEGKVTDSSGNALTGSYNMRFTITSDLAGSTVLWGPETHSSVNASNGTFSVMLGDTTLIPTTVFSGSTTYIKIEIANPATSSNYEALSPLRQLLCAGYSFRSAVTDDVSDGSITSSKLSSGAVTADAIAAGAVTTTKLATTGATAGTYGSATTVGKFTVGVDGRITSAESVTITKGLLAFADFYALMPGDNSATVAVGAPVEFPQDGPTSASDISRLTASTFQLSAIGIYMVSWQVSVAEAGQLVLALGGVEIPNTVVGRATGTSQIVGNRLITTTGTNSILSVVNRTGNSTALTITPNAGGASTVSASLVITRIQ